MNATFGNLDLLRQITSFQRGMPLDLQPFHAFVQCHYINRGRSPRHSSVCPNFLLRRDPEFLHLQLQAFGAIFTPWFAAREAAADIPRLLCVSEKLNLVLLHWTIQYNHIELLHYIHATYHIETYVHPTAIAASRGSLPVIKYLHEANSGEFFPYTMDWAAESGHLDLVEFLHFHRSEGCTTSAMDMAARFGHFNVVKFLHAHRKEGCTTVAMDQAAAFGHFEIVKFLHTYRTEGCTTNALDSACSGGHLDMVKFLHFHRHEGCTTGAFNSACCGGHLEIVKFLHAHRTEGCTHRAMESAAECKRYDVCLYLSEHLPHLVNRSNITVVMAVGEASWRQSEALKKEAAARLIKQKEQEAVPGPRLLTSPWSQLLSTSVQRGVVALMQSLVK
ncbi:hypothetical protein DYB38_004956 [Aphanomyces astaci]|uniref:Ankyrin repeat-containing domain n=1 Tax=Aphanomyces astaci TaxID=112090 RepID=A0A397CXS5_APHAT|nr:hypothetical protein DYB36_007575 [Aphanomyces astaci]RHY50963.1 hypothetical protein DYB38_004956 [Aphanomyces astaci]RHZ18209.1 hypothetical protein DYB31_003841 [Aphanomyces astaci]